MFEEILKDAVEKVEIYPETHFKQSIDIILDQINLDMVKILKYNRI